MDIDWANFAFLHQNVPTSPPYVTQYGTQKQGKKEVASCL